MEVRNTVQVNISSLIVSIHYGQSEKNPASIIAEDQLQRHLFLVFAKAIACLEMNGIYCNW